MYKPILSGVICLLILISPSLLIAGGDFQQKIKSKITNAKNIQFQDKSDIGRHNYDEQVPGEQMPAAVASPAGSEAKEAEMSREGYRLRETGGRAASPLAPIISPYAVYKTDYNAEIEDNVATVKGNILFEVFRKGWTQLPLMSSSVGLIDASVNKGASFVTMQGGRYYLMIDKPGRYNLELEFLIRALRERENGPGSFNFEVVPAPISQFEFTILESGVDIFVEPSIKVEVRRETNKTIAWAVMPNTNFITVRWTKSLPKEAITPVKLEPKVYVDTATYVTIGEGLIRCQANLNYSILQSEISNLRIALPEDVSVLDVQGNNLRDWKVSQKDNQQYLDVYLTFGVKGNYVLNLSYERKIGEGSGVAQVPEIKVVGTERERGYFGLAASTNVELAVNKIEHASLIDVKELPSSIWASTASPILLAFKYLNHPFNIAVEVTRHEEIPVLIAAVDSADYVTLYTNEGKSLTKAVYQVRNNVKQFIHLVLPKNATLWSVFVAGKPVKPAKDKKGSILIPLEKSQLKGESLTQFPVEVVYLGQISKMGPLGNLRLNLPKTDIPINQLSWSVYFPLDYLYFNFGGDLKRKRELSSAALSLFLPASRRQIPGGYKKEAAPRTFHPGEQLSQSESDFLSSLEAAKVRGVLPIRVNVPEQGQAYHFSKLLITEQESPWLSVWFIYGIRQVRSLIRFLLFIVLVVICFRLIRKYGKKKIA